MFGVEWIKRLVSRKPSPVLVKGCEPEGGQKAIYILGTTGVMRRSEAVQLAMEVTPEQINADVQCFAPEGAKLLEATAKRASK